MNQVSTSPWDIFDMGDVSNSEKYFSTGPPLNRVFVRHEMPVEVTAKYSIEMSL